MQADRERFTIEMRRRQALGVAPEPVLLSTLPMSHQVRSLITPEATKQFSNGSCWPDFQAVGTQRL
jgi:hypothetical protein